MIANSLRTRLGDLENSLGDPFDTANPVGFARSLDADEQEAVFSAGEQVLRLYGLNEEFIPQEWGGRLTRLDDMVEIMRAVYRRDPSLGLGYGASSFISAVNVWTAGSVEQKRRLAETLASGRRVAAAYHELAHGNDMASTQCRADKLGYHLSLNGRKEVITNLERSEAFVLFARTSSANGPRSHSQLLIDKSDLSPGSYRYLGRYHTAGMRGVQLGGIEFHNCLVSNDAVIGRAGLGLETALRSFQITRIALVSMYCGVLESGIAVAMRHLSGRRLYGGAAIELPHVRAVIAGAYADFLMANSFASFALRAVHNVTGEAAIYAQAVKLFVSKTIIDAMNDLSEVLGAYFYLREGETAIFQKLLRDAQPAGFGHAARAACQTAVLSQLPLLARRGWRQEVRLPDEVFVADMALDPLDFSSLSITAGGYESLSGNLPLGLTNCPAGYLEPGMAEALDYFATERTFLTRQSEVLESAGARIDASRSAYDLVTRYVQVLVATAAFETWRRTLVRHPESTIAEPTWLAAVLHRLHRRAIGRPPTLPNHLVEYLIAEATNCLSIGRDLVLPNVRSKK